jgi:uncharacterized protein with PQ loop repeat
MHDDPLIIKVLKTIKAFTISCLAVEATAIIIAWLKFVHELLLHYNPHMIKVLIINILTVASTALLYFIFVPQIIDLIRNKKTDGISLTTYSLSFVVQMMTVTIGVLNNDPHNVAINLVSMSQLVIVVALVLYLRRQQPPKT